MRRTRQRRPDVVAPRRSDPRSLPACGAASLRSVIHQGPLLGCPLSARAPAARQRPAHPCAMPRHSERDHGPQDVGGAHPRTFSWLRPASARGIGRVGLTLHEAPSRRPSCRRAQWRSCGGCIPLPSRWYGASTSIWYARDIPGAEARFVPCDGVDDGVGLVVLDAHSSLPATARDVDVPRLYWDRLGGTTAAVESKEEPVPPDCHGLRYVLLHELGHALSLLADEFHIGTDGQFDRRPLGWLRRLLLARHPAPRTGAAVARGRRGRAGTTRARRVAPATQRARQRAELARSGPRLARASSYRLACGRVRLGGPSGPSPSSASWCGACRAQAS